jgi:hypothetical protein
MLNIPERTSSSFGQSDSTAAIVRWFSQMIDLPQLRLQVKLRGNHLYLLCEGQSCPAQSLIVSRVGRALTPTVLAEVIPDAVEQVTIYGRAQGSPRPDWAEVLGIGDSSSRSNGGLDPALSAKIRPTQMNRGDVQGQPAPIDPQQLKLARQGDVGAIAQCLAEALSQHAVAVRVQIKPEGETSRLLVLCESHYSPDASLIAPAIAQKLRELQLPNFRTAQVFGQVQGETQSEWTLRVDLTPPGEMLREWARWGDVGAITKLLNRALLQQQVKAALQLKETTLHITCRSQAGEPDKTKLRSVIAAFFDALAPQGIHAVTIYGIGPDAGSGQGAAAPAAASAPETPAWIDWLTLPAAEKLELTDSTLTVAQRGNIGAIAFLLTRLLNPHLKTYLTTGGMRIQVRRKEDLLHIMADALICPQQVPVTAAVSEFLKPLNITGIQGIRLYGRRAGQTRSQWSWAEDFGSRAPAPRHVAEATPEFAASDAYVGELLGGDLLHESSTLVWQPEPKLVWQAEESAPNPWQEWLHQMVEAVQRVLIQTQLFVHATPHRNLAATEAEPGTIAQGAKVALVWGTLGLLLTLQTDWILGQILRANATSQPAVPAVNAPPTEETVQLPALLLKKPENGDQKRDRDAFNGSGFTQSGRAVISAEATQSADGSTKPLLSAPLQPKAVVDGSKSPYPTLNAKQLDEKLVLYRQFVAQSGPPDILIMGSSRAMRGVDPAALQAALAAQGYPGLKIFNFGVNGSTAQVENMILRRILPAEKLPRLIIWADGARALNSGRLDVTYNAIATSPGYKKLPAEVVAASSEAATPQPVAPTVAPIAAVSDGYQIVNQWLDQTVAQVSTAYPHRENLKSLVQGKLLSALESPPHEASPLLPQDGKGLIDVNGFLPLSVRFNPVTYYQKYARVNGQHDGDYADFRLDGAQTEALAAIAQFSKDQKIPLVFVNLPLTQEYLDPARQAYEDEFQRYMIQSAQEMGFTFRNLVDLVPTEPDLFSDPSHLNRYGAFAVSNHLAKDPLVPWVKR